MTLTQVDPEDLKVRFFFFDFRCGSKIRTGVQWEWGLSPRGRRVAEWLELAPRLTTLCSPHHEPRSDVLNCQLHCADLWGHLVTSPLLVPCLCSDVIEAAAERTDVTLSWTDHRPRFERDVIGISLTQWAKRTSAWGLRCTLAFCATAVCGHGAWWGLTRSRWGACCCCRSWAPSSSSPASCWPSWASKRQQTSSAPCRRDRGCECSTLTQRYRGSRVSPQIFFFSLSPCPRL